MSIQRMTYAAAWLMLLLLGRTVPCFVGVCPAESRPQAGQAALKAPTTAVSSGETGTVPPLPDPIAPVSLPSAGSLAFPEALDRGCDIVLLVDGSAALAKADPSGNWKGALKLFISLLGDEDRIGIVSFGREAIERIPLTQNIEQNRPALFHAIENITAEDAAAGISGGALKGLEELKTSTRRNRLLVLLAGGPVAGMAGQQAAAQVDLMRMLPELKNAHIRLYALAAAERPDHALLDNAARETGGLFRSAQTGRDLHVLLTALFEEIRRPDTLPFEKDSFAVDRDVREAVIVAAKKAGAAVTLLSPTGRRETAAKHGSNTAWYTSTTYDLITLRKPAAGSWRSNMDSGGSRVFITSDLNLQIAPSKSVVKRGETVTVDAWLERGGPVSGKSPGESVAFFADVSGPDGLRETLGMTPRSLLTATAAPSQGPFAVMITCAAPGSYLVTVTAKGSTFTRIKTVSFTTINDSVMLASAGNDRQGAGRTRLPSPGQQGFSWLAVLLKLVLVNLAAAGLAALIVVVRMLIVKMRTRT